MFVTRMLHSLIDRSAPAPAGLAVRAWGSCVVALLVCGCAGSSYVNERTGERIPAHGPAQNADLAACQAEYQRAFAAGPALWMGEIVPACMKARGWRQG